MYLLFARLKCISNVLVKFKRKCITGHKRVELELLNRMERIDSKHEREETIEDDGGCDDSEVRVCDEDRIQVQKDLEKANIIDTELSRRSWQDITYGVGKPPCFSKQKRKIYEREKISGIHGYDGEHREQTRKLKRDESNSRSG